MFEDGKLQLIESAENKNSKTSYLALFKIMEYIKTTKVKVSSADILQTIEVVCCKATENKLKHLRNLWVCYSDGASLVAQAVKNLPAMQEDPDSIPWLGRPPGEGNVNLLQYSCLGNTMDRGARRATVHEVAKSQT